MMVAWLVPVGLSAVVVSAHFFRAGQVGLVAAVMGALTLLFTRQRWVALVLPVLLWLAAGLWVGVAVELGEQRLAQGAPWLRMAAILGAVALLTAASSLVFRKAALRERYQAHGETARASAAAFLLVLLVLGLLQWRMHKPVPLMAERLLPGAGWVEALALAAYAAWLTGVILRTKLIGRVRSRLWLAFSAVFFGQLVLGLSGLTVFLMTGTLHLPIPALIVAGSVYRSTSLFMPILFVSTVLLVGPAWCSYLCYVGSWDNQAARVVKKPPARSSWREPTRLAVLALLVLVALALRFLGVSTDVAAALAVAFGVGGVAVMALVSRRAGSMVHCTAYCPIGLLATVVGKLNPFRIRVSSACDECGACIRTCRYNALDLVQIRARTPALSCTLCGDCVSVCHCKAIDYQAFRARGSGVRTTFLVLVISLHALFLGLARI